MLYPSPLCLRAGEVERSPPPKRSIDAVLEDLVKQLFDAIRERDLDTFAAVVHEHVELEVPYGEGVEPVIGRDAVLGMFGYVLGGMFDRLDLSITTVYPGRDDDAIVIEYQGQANVVSTCRPYANPYIGVFRQRDDLISLWREYYNPLITARAMTQSDSSTK